jgi:hypothetical protein
MNATDRAKAGANDPAVCNCGWHMQFDAASGEAAIWKVEP